MTKKKLNVPGHGMHRKGMVRQGKVSQVKVIAPAKTGAIIKMMAIVDRVIKNKAIGFIYNLSRNDESILQNKLLDDRKALCIRGRDAYTAPMFMFRIASKLKIKKIKFNMIPSLINGKAIVITGADVITGSYNRILDDSYKYKVPVLILMNNCETMTDVRKMPAYLRVLTIEQNFQKL